MCLNPALGKQGTRIVRWKYDLLRGAILDVIPDNAEGVAFKQLAELVERRLSAQQLKRLGSLGWYTTTVKLDLEARGEIERVPDSKPQRLRRPGGTRLASS